MEEREIMKKLLVNLAETYGRTSYALRLEIVDRMIEVYKLLSAEKNKTESEAKV